MVAAASSPITFTLPGFPLVNQLLDPPGDTYPDNNERMNCVPASLSAGASYLTKRTLYGNQLKDAVYGVAYQGPQAAVAYVGYLAGLGVALTPYNNTSGAQLVAHIHAAVAAGAPVVLTMPSQWGIPYPDPLHPSGYTHVGVACGSGPGWLRVMNPWGGFWHDGSDSYWSARLCMGQVWDMTLSARGVPLMGVPTGWRDDGATLTAPNGHVVVRGFRDYIINGAGNGWNPADQPLEDERTVSPFVEHHNHALGSGVRQVFLRTILRWNTPAEGVKESDAGAELLACEGELATAQASIAALQAQITQLNARPTSDPTEHAKAAALDAVMAVYAASSNSRYIYTGVTQAYEPVSTRVCGAEPDAG